MAVDIRGRLLFILQYLQKNTDDQHEVSCAELQSILTEQGYAVKDRRTITNDVKKLKESGYDIVINESIGNDTTFCMCGGILDTPELKMLIDAVSAAAFIPEDKSNELIQKLSALTSTHMSEELLRTTFQTEKLSTGNGVMNHVIYIVNKAILDRKKIMFQYWDYNLNKEKVLHNNGEYYTFSPYSLVWNDGRYYMLGIVDKRPGDINPFRVDLMCIPTILEEPAVPVPSDYNPAEIAKKVFKMYSGEDQEIILEADNKLMKKMIDKFGEHFESWPASDHTFQARVNASISQTFYSWIFQYNGKINIVEPQDVKEQYIQMLKRMTAYAEGVKTACQEPNEPTPANS